MKKNNLKQVFATLIALVAILLIGSHIIFAATNSVPDTIALFTTSLQAPITTTATTMQLVTATYNNGATTLASSTYGFIIDEGTSVQEMVSADCTGTVCTNMTRGLDSLSGTTSIAALEFAHRRGASVKITDAPSTLIHNRVIQGIQGIPNPLFYSPDPTFTAGVQLVDKTYVDNLAFSGAGVINATTGARGISQLATALQTASSTAIGSSGASLVITASNATSTFNAVTGGLKAVITQNNGKIDSNFLSGTFTSTSTLATTTINNISPFGLVASPLYVTNGNSATSTTFFGRDYIHITFFASTTNAAPAECLVLNGDYANHYVTKNDSYGSISADCSTNSQNGIRLNDGQTGEITSGVIDILGASGTPKIISTTYSNYRETGVFLTSTSTVIYTNYANSNAPITSVSYYDPSQSTRTQPSTNIRIYSDTY